MRTSFREVAVNKNFMRISWCIVFFFLSSFIYAQDIDRDEKKITVLLNNISLEEALTILGISYGVEFSYSDDIVPTETRINLVIQDENLTSALDKLLGPYCIGYKIDHR